MNRTLQSWGLAVLRVVVGVVFLVHGYQKFFRIGVHAVDGMFAHLGIPLAGFFAVVVSLVEFGGGILLLLGILTRVAAALNAVDMLVAILFVHLRHGFYAQNMGFEYPLTLLGATLCLTLAGGGALSHS